SKTEAEKAEAAKKVHATYVRIVTELVPDPARRIKSSKRKLLLNGDLKKKVNTQKRTNLIKRRMIQMMMLMMKAMIISMIHKMLMMKMSKLNMMRMRFYKYKIHVRKDKDVEMANAEVKESDKEVTDTAKEDAKKTLEVKDDAKKTEFPLTSLSLSVSSEALIEDKNTMDNGVADIVKHHKRKHDDDNEDPLAGPNQGKQTKRRRTKKSKSSKNLSSTKETPKGKAPTKGSKRV
nr:hypothetical protein [Tanacetum cinerariifolium]